MAAHVTRRAAMRWAMGKQFLRLYVATMIPVILLMVAGTWVADELFTNKSFLDGVREGQQHRYSWVRERLEPIPRDQWQSALDSARRFYPSGLRIESESSARASMHPTADEARRFEKGEVAFAPAPRDMTYAYQRMPGTMLVVSSELRLSSSNSLGGYLYWLLFAAVAAAPILWFWFRPFWRDLERLSLVTGQIGAGNFAVSGLPVRSPAVRPFAAAIDQMSMRIRELIGAQKRLTSSVAHELTTPITQLVFALELLKDAPEPERARDLIEGMAADLKELESLVAELLEYARLEHTTIFEPEETSLTELMRQAIESAQHIPGHEKTIAQKPLASEFDHVSCDAHQMHRAVFNLVRNALLYARSKVELSAERRDERTWIHVDDDGPGIPEDQRGNLFEPFARLDESRARHTGGHGLGLAIVQQVAKLHDGITCIDRSPLGGARVSIAW